MKYVFMDTQLAKDIMWFFVEETLVPRGFSRETSVKILSDFPDWAPGTETCFSLRPKVVKFSEVYEEGPPA